MIQLLGFRSINGCQVSINTAATEPDKQPGGDGGGHFPCPAPPRWPLMLIIRFSCNPAQSRNLPYRTYLFRCPPPRWFLGSHLTSAKRGRSLTRLHHPMQIFQDHLPRPRARRRGERGIVTGGGVTLSGGTQPEGQSLPLICLFSACSYKGYP